MKLIDLWTKIELSPGCWEWQAGRQGEGYALMWLDGKDILVHRLVYKLFRGNIPKGLCVLHHCDNPICVNPSHLFLGTRGDNNRDRASKGRSRANIGETMKRYPERRARGERQGSAKLIAKDVISIRNLYAEGTYSQRQLAKRFCVGKTCIRDIVKYETWRPKDWDEIVEVLGGKEAEL